jgi:hypothetical protein
MEYKIFGATRQPPDDFKDDLAAFLRLDADQRHTIVEWFLSADTYAPFAPQLPAIILTSTLLPEQFRQTAGVIRSLVYNWRGRNLELTEIERDLLLLGCDSEQIGIISNVLETLTSIKDRVWIDGRKEFERFAGLPTIDDVNILWNARPVFGGDAYYYFESDSASNSYESFLGLVYLATIEIKTSDNNGGKQRIAIQMDEQAFERLQGSMKRAGDQLKILKEHTKETALYSKEIKGGK